MLDTKVKPSIRMAEFGRLSFHAKAYEFLVPSPLSCPLMHKIRPLDSWDGKERYSGSFFSCVSFKELINHVFPVMAVLANLRSLRGRKVTESRSLAAMHGVEVGGANNLFPLLKEIPSILCKIILEKLK